ARAVVYSKYGKPEEVLRVISHKLPPLTSNTLHLRFLASPITQSDIQQIEGTFLIKPKFTKTLGSLKFKDEVAIGGNEGVAEVIAVGKNVKNIKIGDKVVMSKIGFGTWRTYAEATEDDILRLPISIGTYQAATLRSNIFCAYRLLKDYAHLKKGDFIVQNGANGGVGRAVIQLAKAWGIKTINIIRDRPISGRSEVETQLAMLGANYVIEEFEWPSQNTLYRWTGDPTGKNVSLALNTMGGQSILMMSHILRDESQMVTYGTFPKITSLSIPKIEISTDSLMVQEIVYRGFWLPKWLQTHSREEKVKMLNDVIHLVKEGKLNDVPHSVIDWGDVEDDEEKLKDELLKMFEHVGVEFTGRKQVIRFQT
ncbi:17004_t:CDS:2, partial [Acaulospora morrowiae]